MGYVEENLMPGERIEYRAHLHWAMYVPAIAALLVAIGFAVVSYAMEQNVVALGFAAFFAFIGLISAIATWIKRSSSEFAVTNRRVLIKVGIWSRHTLELLLTKVEGVGVDQTIWGRLFGFGTIIVSGTGGTREQFARIANPLEFRRAVQNHATMASEGFVSPDAPVSAGTGPYCTKCGAQNPMDARFCNKCGAAIVTTA